MTAGACAPTLRLPCLTVSISALPLDAEFGGYAYQCFHQPLDMLFRMRRSTGDAQQVLRSRGAEYRIGVNALFQEALAEAAEIQFLLNHKRDDGRLAGQHVENARAQFVAEQLRDAQQVEGAFRLLLPDVQSRAHSGNTGRREARRESERPRSVFQVIDDRTLAGDKSADRGERLD